MSGGGIIKIFDELNEAGHTVILITHDMNIANHCRRIIRLKDGLIDDGNGHGASQSEAASE